MSGIVISLHTLDQGELTTDYGFLHFLLYT